MRYIFDTNRRVLTDDRGVAVQKLYLKRYDKVAWDMDILGGGSSVGFSAGRFDGTGVIPLIKTSSPVSGGKATLTPQSNTEGLRDSLIQDGQLLPSVEFPGEFVVTDGDGKRIASLNIPVEFAAAIDSPDADVEELGRATLTVSLTTLPAGSQGTASVEPTANGYNFKFALPEGAPGADGQDGKDGKDGAPGGVESVGGQTGAILLGSNLSMDGNTINAEGGTVDLSDYDGPVRIKRNGKTVFALLTEKDTGGTDDTMVYIEMDGLGGPVAIRSTPDGGNPDPALVAIDGTVTPGPDMTAYVKKTDYASGSQYGLVRIGSNISVSNGVISLPYASASSYGVMRAGSGLSASGGVISVQGGSGGGGVESINGQTGAVTLHLGVTTLPDNPDIHAIYLYSKDSYGNMLDASESYMIGLEGAGVSSKATSCLTVGGSLDGDTLNIQTSDGQNILSYNGSGAIMIGDTSMTVNVESEQLNLAGKNGVSVRADGTSRISIGAGGSERIDIGGSHHVISIVSTGRSGSNDAVYIQGGSQSISMTYLTPATKIYGDVTVNNQPIQ